MLWCHSSKPCTDKSEVLRLCSAISQMTGDESSDTGRPTWGWTSKKRKGLPKPHGPTMQYWSPSPQPSVRDQLILWDPGQWASSSCGMSVYFPATAGLHLLTPRRMLGWVGLVGLLQLSTWRLTPPRTYWARLNWSDHYATNGADSYWQNAPYVKQTYRYCLATAQDDYLTVVGPWCFWVHWAPEANEQVYFHIHQALSISSTVQSPAQHYSRPCCKVHNT